MRKGDWRLEIVFRIAYSVSAKNKGKVIAMTTQQILNEAGNLSPLLFF